MKKVFCFYNENSPLQVAALAMIANKYPDLDVLEMNTITASTPHQPTVAEMVTSIGTLTDGTYDFAYILNAVSSAGTAHTGGVTGVLSYDVFAALRLKMKVASRGLLKASGTVFVASPDTNGTHAVTLNAIDNQSVNYYNLMIVQFAGTRTEARRITTYATTVGGDGGVATLGGAVLGGAPTVASTYSIYDVSESIFTLNGTETSLATLAANQSTTMNVWENLYPTVAPSQFVQFTGCKKFAVEAGQISDATNAATGVYILDITPDASIAATTLELAKDDFEKDMYLYASSGTGAGQFKKIKSYVGSTRTVTLESKFETALTNSTYYRVVRTLDMVFADVALEAVSKVIFKNANVDIVSQQTMAALIDNEGLLQQNGVSKQDIKLLDSLIEKGQMIFEYTNVANL